MLCDHSLKNKVFIILVVVVNSAEHISAAMSGAGFHNQLHSPRHMCCGDVTIKVIWFHLIKKTDFYFDGFSVNTFTFLCVYDMRIVLLKWNGETLMKWLGAVLEMFVYLCLHWDVTRASVCVCALKKMIFALCSISLIKMSSYNITLGKNSPNLILLNINNVI